MISGQIEERFCRQKCIFQVDGEGETIYKKQATLEIEVGESTIYNFAQNFQISKKFHNVKNVKINNMVKIATCISS